MQKLKRNNQGFTIIEVVLVLAIAGLIFLIVFLALPGLQRGRRDTQRKNDAGRIMSALDTYAGNNGGVYPNNLTTDVVTSFGTDSAANSFWERYADVDNTLRNPSNGNIYTVGVGVASGDAVADFAAPRGDQVVYARNASCNGEFLQAGTGDRQVAVVVELEAGTTYCQDNQ